MENNILLIEDNPENLENFSEMLGLAGYNVLESSNGERGIHIAENREIHLIISDIKLPDINGFDLLRYIKGNPKTKGIPFLFLSACIEKHAISRSEILGADAYLIKPCCMHKLLDTIDKVFLSYLSCKAFHNG